MIRDTKYIIQPYIYGLGGREIFKEDIKKIFQENWDGKETKYIGLK